MSDVTSTADDFTVGEIDWGDVPDRASRSSGSSRRVPYLNMREAGDYKIRVISKPFQYYCHWVDGADGKRHKVNAAMQGNDPICLETGKAPQVKWLVKVLYQFEGKSELRLLDAGPQIMQQIKALHEDEKNFGNVSKYDIIITKGKKGSTPLYTVKPTGNAMNPQDLTATQKQLVRDSSDPNSESFVDIALLCRPWTTEQILGVIEGNRDGSDGSAETSSESTFDDEEFIDL